MTKIPLSKYVEGMEDLACASEGGDVEAIHGEADDLLCEALEDLGWWELVASFKKVHKWYA